MLCKGWGGRERQQPVVTVLHHALFSAYCRQVLLFRCVPGRSACKGRGRLGFEATVLLKILPKTLGGDVFAPCLQFCHDVGPLLTRDAWTRRVNVSLFRVLLLRGPKKLCYGILERGDASLQACQRVGDLG